MANAASFMAVCRSGRRCTGYEVMRSFLQRPNAAFQLRARLRDRAKHALDLVYNLGHAAIETGRRLETYRRKKPRSLRESCLNGSSLRRFRLSRDFTSGVP